MVIKKLEAMLTTGAQPGPTFRSGSVARMVQMPVATLRIWEQRYQAVRPATARSGHRLYSSADVQRVTLLRDLTTQGHAIGSIAALDSAQLQALTRQHAGDSAPGVTSAARPTGALRLVVVGHALAARLQRPAVAQQLGTPAKVLAAFDSLAQATRDASGSACDLLLWHVPGVQAGVPPELKAAQDAWQASKLAVVYRFAGAAAKAAFADVGACLLREPPDDAALGAWLASLQATQSTTRSGPAEENRLLLGMPVAARRYDDAALGAIAGLSSSLACECPRHVAELLMQLASFEAFSASCIHNNAADAELHACLQQMAGASRALFESALERVAQHEGFVLERAETGGV